MAPKSQALTESPSHSTSFLPLRMQSRRGSNGSLPPASKLDKETLHNALDQIHSVASQSATLTTFNDFATPPTSSSGTEPKGITSELQGGISGLYNRFRASVGGVKDAASTVVASERRNDLTDDASSIKSISQKSGGLPSPAANKLTFKPPKYDSPTSSVSNLKSASTQRVVTGQAIDSLDQSSKFEPKPHRDSGSRQSAQLSLSGVLAGDDVDVVTSRHLDANDAVEDLQRQQAISPRTAIPIALQDATRKEVPKTEDKTPSALYDKIREKPTSQQGPYGVKSPTESSKAGHAARERAGIPSHNDGCLVSADEPLHTSQPAAKGLPKIPLATPLQQHQKGRLSAPTPEISFSRASSYEAGAASSVSTTLETKSGSEEFPDHEKQHTITRTAPKSSATVQASADSRAVNGVLSQTRTRVLSKQYWMRDENARECFHCGDAFSTFRRKHHCSKL